MEITKEDQSVLRLKNLYFDHLTFENSGFTDEKVEDSPKMRVSVSISKDNEAGFSAILVTEVIQTNLFRLSCSLTGSFEVEGGLTEENAFLRDNAIAIMFPYVRSEITLLTSQPGMKPIVIPALNIKKMLSSAEE